ncbi:ATP-dependent nuclease [Mycobacterium rhizamassiliense]|uniref:ATP-dependent nuclease n=1 Tax=Mycobacterium rhizamassiliense TaxID=1841860 RepID=UPI00097DC1F4|nr:TOPRIM nucleotidyl transferase/hydrolase domain-containing protein [Mycobacterium rhizamassiliense]
MDGGYGCEVVNVYAHPADPCPKFPQSRRDRLTAGSGFGIVGENRSGKSNLIHALRLVLDTTLSIADRQLDRDDFWDGLSDGSPDWDPLSAGHVIEVSIDIVGFADNARVLTALADALVEQDPPHARLTYRFGPVDMGDDAIPLASRYQGRVYGGDSYTRDISTSVRRQLHFHLLPALRDVESDIARWRGSPLRELLERAAREVSDDDLTQVRAAMRTTNDRVNDLDQIRDLSGRISERLTEMVGPYQAVDTDLAVAPEDPMRLIRSMRIFVDGPLRRRLSSASLGTLNIIYLALLDLGLQDRLSDQVIAHTVVAIEEPEAHLHPHLQRVIFRQVLTEANDERTVVVTTQSPHIVSVTDPRKLIMLRSQDDQTTVCAATSAVLQPGEWNDIARYLDATRAEIVFARKVLLVEGFAEQVLVPVMAAQIGIDLDKLGISVCAVHGTHFGSYVRFCAALSIPWAVLTDGDPDTAGVSRGGKRAADLIASLELAGPPSAHGCFVGNTTFEYDLVASEPRNVAAAFDALTALSAAPSAAVIKGWGDTVPDQDTFMRAIANAGGKGRYAQRLAEASIEPPGYVDQALRYLAQT